MIDPNDDYPKWMRIMFWTIVSYFVLVLIPQIIKTCKNKSLKDISILWIII